MTDDQFGDWIRYHVGAFPGIATWLESNPDQVPFWRRAIIAFGYDDAVRATDRLFEGSAPRPTGWGQHAAAVRRLCREASSDRLSRPIVVDGEYAARCARCGDTGQAAVWRPTLVRYLRQIYPEAIPLDWMVRPEVRRAAREPLAERIRAGRPEPAKLSGSPDIVCACDCAAGDRYADDRKSAGGRTIPGNLRFDASRMAQYAGGEAGVEELNQWIRARKKPR